ncbi:uncharacterized protein BDZ99DRAFT_483818 [Mytilinidion resinicola]|uniref:Pentatricopeptide repeat protein n=1 Tax=Mytilinidion resinicola TaxID=574789 RepID=A0A6A6Y002_9PEZI|nr:uncharacterized protein BDZ99DRAFT_483818 [Mytilinidion resinicola]KAF2801324.1 hypothetical protein BDZ99DRAFT_483818 [Mytilinidion resinicola]
MPATAPRAPSNGALSALRQAALYGSLGVTTGASLLLFEERRRRICICKHIIERGQIVSAYRRHLHNVAIASLRNEDPPELPFESPRPHPLSVSEIDRAYARAIGQRRRARLIPEIEDEYNGEHVAVLAGVKPAPDASSVIGPSSLEPPSTGKSSKDTSSRLHTGYGYGYSIPEKGHGNDSRKEKAINRINREIQIELNYENQLAKELGNKRSKRSRRDLEKLGGSASVSLPGTGKESEQSPNGHDFVRDVLTISDNPPKPRLADSLPRIPQVMDRLLSLDKLRAITQSLPKGFSKLAPAQRRSISTKTSPTLKIMPQLRKTVSELHARHQRHQGRRDSQQDRVLQIPLLPRAQRIANAENLGSALIEFCIWYKAERLESGKGDATKDLWRRLIPISLGEEAVNLKTVAIQDLKDEELGRVVAFFLEHFPANATLENSLKASFVPDLAIVLLELAAEKRLLDPLIALSRRLRQWDYVTPALLELICQAALGLLQTTREDDAFQLLVVTFGTFSTTARASLKNYFGQVLEATSKKREDDRLLQEIIKHFYQKALDMTLEDQMANTLLQKVIPTFRPLWLHQVRKRCDHLLRTDRVTEAARLYTINMAPAANRKGKTTISHLAWKLASRGLEDGLVDVLHQMYEWFQRFHKESIGILGKMLVGAYASNKNYGPIIDLFQKHHDDPNFYESGGATSIRPAVCWALALHAPYSVAVESIGSFLPGPLDENSLQEYCLLSLPELLRRCWRETRNMESVESLAQEITAHARFANLPLKTVSREMISIRRLALEGQPNISPAEWAERTSDTIADMLVYLAGKAQWQILGKVLEDAHQADLLLSIHKFSQTVFNPVLKIYMRGHDSQATQSFVSQAIEKYQVIPTQRTLDLVVDALTKDSRVDAIGGWVGYLRSKGFRLSVNTRTAVTVLRRFFLTHRPPHGTLLRLARKLCSADPVLKRKYAQGWNQLRARHREGLLSDGIAPLLQASMAFHLKAKRGVRAQGGRKEFDAVYGQGVVKLHDMEDHITEGPTPRDHITDDNIIERAVVEDTLEKDVEEDTLQKDALKEDVLEKDALKEDVFEEHSARILPMRTYPSVSRYTRIENAPFLLPVAPDATQTSPPLSPRWANSHPCAPPFEKDALQKDALQKDALQKDALQKDALQKDALQNDALQKDALKEDVFEEDLTQLEKLARVSPTLAYVRKLQRQIADVDQSAEKSSSTLYGNSLEATMTFALNQGKNEEVVKEYSQLLDKGLLGSQVTMEIAVEAALRSNSGDASKAAPIIERARELGMDVRRAQAPILHHHMISSRMSPQEIHDAVFASFRNRSEGNLAPAHYIAVVGAHNLVHRRKPREAVVLLTDVYLSSWAREIPVDIRFMTMFLYAYGCINNLRGIQWVVQTVLDGELRIDRHFIVNLKQARRKSRKALASQPLSHKMHQDRLIRLNTFYALWIARCEVKLSQQAQQVQLLGERLVEMLTVLRSPFARGIARRLECKRRGSSLLSVFRALKQIRMEVINRRKRAGLLIRRQRYSFKGLHSLRREQAENLLKRLRIENQRLQYLLQRSRVPSLKQVQHLSKRQRIRSRKQPQVSSERLRLCRREQI